MMGTRIASAFLLTAVCLCSSGCFFKRKKPLPVTAIPPAPKPDPVVLPAPPPPRIEEATKPKTGKTPAVSTSLPDTIPQPPPTKKTTRRTRRTTAQAKPAANGDKPPTADPGANGQADTAPAPGPLKLGEFLSDAQRAEIQKQFEQTMQRARTSLEKLVARGATGAAAESIDRVKAFLLQADQARARDPQTALQLAQRADVLAADLLNR